MKRNLLTLPLLALLSGCMENNLQVQRVTCEYQTNPLAIEKEIPKLGWQLNAPDGVSQSAYRILVADNPVDLENDRGGRFSQNLLCRPQMVDITE